MKYIIALDIGGTKIAGALFKRNILIKKVNLKTHARKGKEFVIKKIIEVISLLKEGINKENILGIGIGMPGPVNHKTGIIHFTPNMSGWVNVPLRNILEKKFKVRVIVENDTNCAALAESIYHQCNNLICITIGTGLGGGVIINGEIYHGCGVAGELGHMVIKFDGPKCNCGNKGCLEEFVSGRGIERISKKIFNKKIDPKTLQGMAERGNRRAIEVYKELGKLLGVGLANLANIFNPEMVVIGGSISKAKKLFLKEAVKEMKKRAFTVSIHNLKVVISELGDNAGLIGAAALVSQELKRNFTYLKNILMLH